MTEKPGVPTERQLADVALDPLFGGAAIASSFSKHLCGRHVEVTATFEALVDRAKAVRANKLGSAEDMLTAQAAALNTMFLELARRSGANMGEYMPAVETYMRLALKAQAQCRATLETPANIKNPPVVYARQANIANGPQQVNNGAAAPARAIRQVRRTNYWRQSMANGWGPERRARQSEAIRRWKPWERSTGPQTVGARQAPAATPIEAASGRRSGLS